MAEATIRGQIALMRGVRVTSDPGIMTYKAGSRPCADVTLHLGPNITLAEEPRSGPYSRMTSDGEGVKTSPSERCRPERPRLQLQYQKSTVLAADDAAPIAKAESSKYLADSTI